MRDVHVGIGPLARLLRAKASQGSNSIEGHDLSLILAAAGRKVTNTTYRRQEGLDRQVATYDLRLLDAAGLLKLVGMGGGAHYVAGDKLTAALNKGCAAARAGGRRARGRRSGAGDHRDKLTDHHVLGSVAGCSQLCSQDRT